MFVMSTVIITGSASLRVLDVSANPINDDEMSLTPSELQHNNVLRVYQCGLSVKGVDL